MTLEPIAPGLHESLVTTDLQSRLALVSGLDVATGQIDPADLPHVLAQHVYASAHRAFSRRSDEDAVALANQLIDALQDAGTEVITPATQLLRIAPVPGPGVVTYADVRPRTPLAEAALMTNAKSEPSLGPELRTEIDTADHVEFPFLPSGCQIVMDKETQAAVLANLKTQIGSRWIDLLAELRSIGNVNLREYIEESGAALPDLLKSGRSWTRLRREAGFETRPVGPREDELVKRGRSLIHVDDRARASTYRAVLRSAADPGLWSPAERRLAEMLFFSLWPNGGGFTSVEEGIRSLRDNEVATDELSTIVDLGFEDARRTTLELAGDLAGVPLQVHGRYRREEILAGLGYSSLTRRPNSFVAGVCWVEEVNTDALLVTLKKSSASFSPTTMYQDYPISPTLFHWESQNATTVASAPGQRYIKGRSTVLLFVRETSIDEYGDGAPFLFLGPVTYVKHEGERPIAITWKLETPMPIDFFTAAKVVAS